MRRISVRPGHTLWGLAVVVAFLLLGSVAAQAATAQSFPPPLASYQDAHLSSIWDILKNRVEKQPFNLWATLFFLGAVLHTFFTQRFRHLAHLLEKRHQARQPKLGDKVLHVSVPARLFHFLGEVEVVFGIWLVPLFVVMVFMVGAASAIDYVDLRVSFTEPVFVVVIMAIASTRPILGLAERCLRVVAGLGGGGPVAWWFAILTFGPLLGSFITEPGAMTISAALLARQFYALQPRRALAYATLGLLFVNISVGGTLTHFAAPPVLMVAGAWQWDTVFMMRRFGWIAAGGIAVSNLVYYLVFRKDFAGLAKAHNTAVAREPADGPIPAWVTIGHVFFMGLTVLCAHHSRFVIICILFFIAFFEMTEDYQREFSMRGPVLVGFFLAGLVLHGGLQQWWIAPVLGRLSELPLFISAIGLTAFNDNAAITYLSTLVPDLSDALKFAVVAGAVTGGGLTIIANAPNPAGQSILQRFFEDGISPLGLFLGALFPTLILALGFVFLGG
jgi:hypothetical protein